MYIETETTPNPATLKFLPQRQVMPQGTRDFASPEDAEASPLAQALFDTGEVTGLSSCLAESTVVLPCCLVNGDATVATALLKAVEKR